MDKMLSALCVSFKTNAICVAILCILCILCMLYICVLNVMMSQISTLNPESKAYNF